MNFRVRRFYQTATQGVVTASGSSWSPASLGASLIAWYKSDTGVYSDAGTTLAVNGSAVYQWNDQSGNGLNFVQSISSNRPTFNTATFNGHQGITFTGSTQNINSNLFGGLSATTASVFVMFESQTGASANGRIFSFQTAGGNDYDNAQSFELQQIGGTTQTVSHYGDVGVVNNAFSYAFNTPQSIGTVYDGTNVTDYRAFTSQGATAYSATIGGGGLNYFGIGNYNFLVGASHITPPSGIFAEIVLTNSAISGTDRTNLKNYFSNKWGVS